MLARTLSHLICLVQFKKVVMSTCGVISGEVTSAACLIRWHHPHTRTGGPTAVPAPLQEDINTVNHPDSQSHLLNVGAAKCGLVIKIM